MYYPAGGAMRVNGTLYYVLKDHLGSASVVTDSSGNVVSEQRYYPFGETRLAAGTLYTDKLFTGQREITGLGIYHYQARFYSQSLGRFISPDTIIPGYASPQSLNRFAYVLNNPVRYVDPSGHRTCTGEQAARGDETCWQNVWAQFRSEKQQELDRATGKNKPRILFDKVQTKDGKIVSISPRSDKEALAFMQAGERAVQAVTKSIAMNRPIDSCNDLVAAMMGIKDVDKDGQITDLDYADPDNGLANQNGSVFSNTFTPEVDIVIFGGPKGGGLVAPLHSGVVVVPDKNNPLKTAIIQTNTKPSTYGIYFTTIGGNIFSDIFPVWYLTK